MRPAHPAGECEQEEYSCRREGVSELYALSLVLAAPAILLHMHTLRLLPRRPLLLAAGTPHHPRD